MLGAAGDSVASDFLGFFPNVSGIPSGLIADEKWAAITGGGDFEIQDPTSFYASERWYSYNPFRGAGYRPWATITLADATTQDHVPFTDPDTGIVSDWRIVNITEHAERFTTAVGEAFFIQDEQKIKMVTAYTPHLDGEVEYVSEPYEPSVKPLMVFWGTGQASAEPAVPVVHGLTGDNGNQAYRYQFNGENPDEVLIGENPGARMLAAADVPAGYIELLTLEAALLDYQILELPPGLWRLWFTANTKETADTEVAGWLYEAAGVGDDELKIHRASGYAAVFNDPLGAVAANDRLAMNIRMHNIILEVTVTEYLTIIGNGFNTAVATDGIHNLMLEKLR